MTNTADRAKVPPMNYAPLLAATLVLWPVMALLGGQGFTPLLGLAALPALFFLRPFKGFAPYALAAIAFVIWAGLTELWSPASKGFITGSLSGGDLALRAASLRIVLVLLAAMASIAAALRIAPGSAASSARIMLIAFGIQGAILLLLAPMSEQVLGLVYGTAEDSEAVTEGLQNVLRNANAYSVILPVLATVVWIWGGPRWMVGACALWALSFGTFILLGTQAAVFGVILALAFIALVHFRPDKGFKWLMSGIAGYIALAPLLLGGGTYIADKLGITVPGSFQSRLWSWEVVSGKIMERPLSGHGLSASKTWRETYADHPDWLEDLPDFWASYPVVPGHPHNMPLQIWAETGAIGAGLAALSVYLLGRRVPAPVDLPPTIRYSAAGMIGAGLTLFSFAYSAWNEAFWAMLVLAVLALILLARQHNDAPAS